jgi:hypothetical protein
MTKKADEYRREAEKAEKRAEAFRDKALRDEHRTIAKSGASSLPKLKRRVGDAATGMQTVTNPSIRGRVTIGSASDRLHEAG